MSTLIFPAGKRLDGPKPRTGDDADARATSCREGLAEATHVFFAFAGMPLAVPESAVEQGEGN